MPEPRFKVVTVTGWPIQPRGRTDGHSLEGLSATVLDSFYGSEHGTWRSEEKPRGPGHGYAAIGPERALALAMERCAELNEWDEREAARTGQGERALTNHSVRDDKDVFAHFERLLDGEIGFLPSACLICGEIKVRLLHPPKPHPPRNRGEAAAVDGLTAVGQEDTPKE